MQTSRSVLSTVRYSQSLDASIDSASIPSPRRRLARLGTLVAALGATLLCTWACCYMISMMDDHRQLQYAYEMLTRSDRELPARIVDYINDIAAEPLSGSIQEMALHLRIYKRLRTAKSTWHDQASATMLLQALTKKLFSWYQSVDLMTEEPVDKAKEQRGIVICTGQKHFAFAVHAIKSIRLWNCTLPIEVFYTGEIDLKPEARALLDAMEGVRTVNIESVIHNHLLYLEGWDAKPFALLGSSFKEVILMDADVIYMQNPETLFDREEYERDGALFFIDRIFKTCNINYVEWFQRIIPGPHSSRLQQSHMYRGETNYEQESGVVVIDKGRRLYGLLAACLLNAPKERSEIHSRTHGEKETFWLGFEIAEEPYEFYEKQAGLIGQAPTGWDQKTVLMCGHLAHFDKESRLLWFNDAIVADKNRNLVPGNFTHYVSAGPWSGLCKRSSRIKPVSDAQRQMLEQMKALWVTDPLAPK